MADLLVVLEADLSNRHTAVLLKVGPGGVDDGDVVLLVAWEGKPPIQATLTLDVPTYPRWSWPWSAGPSRSAALPGCCPMSGPRAGAGRYVRWTACRRGTVAVSVVMLEENYIKQESEMQERREGGRTLRRGQGLNRARRAASRAHDTHHTSSSHPNWIKSSSNQMIQNRVRLDSISDQPGGCSAHSRTCPCRRRCTPTARRH